MCRHDKAEAEIRRYIFLNLSDQRAELAAMPEIEVSAVDSEGAVLVSMPPFPQPETPTRITVGGMPIDEYQRLRHGNMLVFVDAEKISFPDNSIVFPQGRSLIAFDPRTFPDYTETTTGYSSHGGPGWFVLTIDLKTGAVLDHHWPSTM
jgi:hypothetical protein